MLIAYQLEAPAEVEGVEAGGEHDEDCQLVFLFYY